MGNGSYRRHRKHQRRGRASIGSWAAERDAEKGRPAAPGIRAVDERDDDSM
jgi:hypothetical protein